MLQGGSLSIDYSIFAGSSLLCRRADTTSSLMPLESDDLWFEISSKRDGRPRAAFILRPAQGEMFVSEGEMIVIPPPPQPPISAGVKVPVPVGVRALRPDPLRPGRGWYFAAAALPYYYSVDNGQSRNLRWTIEWLDPNGLPTDRDLTGLDVLSLHFECTTAVNIDSSGRRLFVASPPYFSVMHLVYRLWSSITRLPRDVLMCYVKPIPVPTPVVTGMTRPIWFGIAPRTSNPTLHYISTKINRSIEW